MTWAGLGERAEMTNKCDWLSITLLVCGLQATMNASKFVKSSPMRMRLRHAAVGFLSSVFACQVHSNCKRVKKITRRELEQ